MDEYDTRPYSRIATALAMHEALHRKVAAKYSEPRIQTTCSYCPKDNVFSLAICPVSDGPTFTFDMLTRADLDEIESVVSCLKDSHDYP